MKLIELFRIVQTVYEPLIFDFKVWSHTFYNLLLKTNLPLFKVPSQVNETNGTLAEMIQAIYFNWIEI